MQRCDCGSGPEPRDGHHPLPCRDQRHGRFVERRADDGERCRIMDAARLVSAHQTARSVRGVGCCSMVREAPRIHTAWASGATSAGSPASTATAEAGADSRHSQVSLRYAALGGGPRPSCAATGCPGDR